MEANKPDIAQIVSSKADSPSRVSFREILARLFFRFRIFLFFVLFVPIFSLFLVYLVPYNYKSTAKLLIRYDTRGLPFFTELATSKRQVISGQSDAEIIKSLPVTSYTVKQLNIKESDIAKPAYKIILSYFAKPFYFFIRREESEGQGKVDEVTRLAKELKDSIDSRIIQKWRPEIEISDELIEVVVKSPNREKVAQIANKLCEGFIDEYYRLSEGEARRAYDYLTKQIEKLEEELRKSKLTSESGSAMIPEDSAINFPSLDWSDRNINNNPVVDSTAKQVAQLELQLERLKHIYKADAPELLKVKRELVQARKRLERHKALESASALLDIFKDKRHKAYMTMQIFKNRLIPISIVEKGVTPPKSLIVLVGRYMIVAVIGLFIGMFFGFSFVMFLTAMDHRLCTPWDVEREGGLPVIGSIPAIPENHVKLDKMGELPIKEATSTVMQALGRLDLVGDEEKQVVLITGVSEGEGKTFLAIQLACALAGDKRTKILLIDANFENPTVSTLLGQDNKKGLIDALKHLSRVRDVIYPTILENLEVIPTGDVEKRHSLGFYKKSLRGILGKIRADYDGIIIDGSGVLTSTDAPIFASEADHTIMIVKSEHTRREPFAKAIGVLSEVGVKCFGVILNFRRYRIPRMFYGN